MRSTSGLDRATRLVSMSNSTFFARANISEIHSVFVGMPEILARTMTIVHCNLTPVLKHVA